MKELTLTKNKVCVVDDDDYPWLSNNKWTYTEQGYAVRTRKRKREYLHRIILNVPVGMYADHINGDKLDNRRVNLRIVSASINNINKHKARSDSKSGIIGVWFKEFKQKGNSRIYNGWIAEIRFKNKKTVRMFRTKEQAIECRKNMELKYRCV